MSLECWRIRILRHGGALALMVGTCHPALELRAQPRIEGPALACMPASESRKLYVTNKLVPPFRVMRETALSSRAEAIDIQLCRYGGALVYDVTLLNEAGEILHRLVDAANGAALPGYPLAGHGIGPRARELGGAADRRGYGSGPATPGSTSEGAGSGSPGGSGGTPGSPGSGSSGSPGGGGPGSGGKE